MSSSWTVSSPEGSGDETISWTSSVSIDTRPEEYCMIQGRQLIKCILASSPGQPYCAASFADSGSPMRGHIDSLVKLMFCFLQALSVQTVQPSRFERDSPALTLIETPFVPLSFRGTQEGGVARSRLKLVVCII